MDGGGGGLGYACLSAERKRAKKTKTQGRRARLLRLQGLQGEATKPHAANASLGTFPVLSLLCYLAFQSRFRGNILLIVNNNYFFFLKIKTSGRTVIIFFSSGADFARVSYCVGSLLKIFLSHKYVLYFLN